MRCLSHSWQKLYLATDSGACNLVLQLMVYSGLTVETIKRPTIILLSMILIFFRHDSGFSQLSELEGLTGLCAGGNDYSTGLPPALLGLSQIKELGLGYSKLQNKPENKKYYDK